LRTIFDGRGLVAVKWATASPLLRCPADDGEEDPGTATQFREKELSNRGYNVLLYHTGMI